MTEVSLHRALDEDGDAGYLAWSPLHLGFATWAGSESEVLARVPSKLKDYLQFRQLLSDSNPSAQQMDVEVIERIAGNEVLFSHDHEAATSGLIEETIALAEAARRDLVELVAGASDRVLDWDPPYRRFRSWARWRTIRQVLAHVANTETHYYLSNIGIRPDILPASEEGAWQDNIAAHREATLEALHSLKASGDLAVDSSSRRNISTVRSCDGNEETKER